jgi:hypothetical protein
MAPNPTKTSAPETILSLPSFGSNLGDRRQEEDGGTTDGFDNSRCNWLKRINTASRRTNNAYEEGLA